MNPNNLRQDASFPQELWAYIEVQKNTRTKYEYDETIGGLVLDRVLHSAVFYPHNYGFIPETLCGDGDPLDVLVMTSDPLLPGTFCKVRPICHLVMEDEKGRDEKLLAVAINDPCHNNIFKKGDISPHILEEISVFFQTYKMSEKTKWVKVYEWSNEEETITLVRETHNAFSRKNQKTNQKTLSSERIPRDISVLSLGFDYSE